MTNTQFDLDGILNTYRDTFAPVLRAQQEGLKTIERLARYQFAVAGDYLEWSLAQAKIGGTAHSASDGVAQLSEINGRLGDKLRARAEEFSQIATETRGAVSQWFDQAGAEVAEKVKKAA